MPALRRQVLLSVLEGSYESWYYKSILKCLWMIALCLRWECNKRFWIWTSNDKVMHEWIKGGTWIVCNGVIPWTSKFLRSTLRKGNAGGVMNMLHSYWWSMSLSKCVSSHTPPCKHIPYHFATQNTKMQLSKFLFPWGKEGINKTVSKCRSPILMKSGSRLLPSMLNNIKGPYSNTKYS